MPNNTRSKSAYISAVPKLHVWTLLIVAGFIILTFAVYPSSHQKQLSRSLLLPEHILGHTKTLEVKSGDNLSSLAAQINVNGKEVYQILDSGIPAQKLLDLYPGQKISFQFDKYDRFIALTYRPSVTETLFVHKNLNDFETNFVVKELSTNLKFASGVIEDSLFLAGYQSGLSDNIIMELANIFGWDVDFVLDIRKGDSFNVLYEEKFLDDKKVKNGNILIAQFTNQGKTHTAVRFEDEQGDIDYYDPEGRSMRKTFRRNPLDIVRITSHFNLKRKHPVLHKIRAHKGIDYAAGTGTPIRATSDGKVILARRKGGYGKAVVIKHGQKYSTLYAHMSKYGRKIKEGRSVKQGQIIGYVGSTGLATGPHLHYELRVNGVHRNPLTVKFPAAKPVKKDSKESFLQHSEYIQATLTQYEADSLYAHTATDTSNN